MLSLIALIACKRLVHIIGELEAISILKPNGLLLSAESTRYHIETLQIRLLFRHLMAVQRAAVNRALLLPGWCNARWLSAIVMN